MFRWKSEVFSGVESIRWMLLSAREGQQRDDMGKVVFAWHHHYRYSTNENTSRQTNQYKSTRRIAKQ